jgi:hypothetical protein
VIVPFASMLNGGIVNTGSGFFSFFSLLLML